MNSDAPHFPLSLVKALTRSGYYELRQESALDYFGTDVEAYEFFESTVEDLEESNFSESITMRLTREEADVYGFRRDGRGWYLKLTVIMNRRMVVFSLHPLKEGSLETKGGLVKP